MGTPEEEAALHALIKLNRARASIIKRVHGGLREHGLADIQLGALDVVYDLGPLPIKVMADKNL